MFLVSIVAFEGRQNSAPLVSLPCPTVIFWLVGWQDIKFTSLPVAKHEKKPMGDMPEKKTTQEMAQETALIVKVAVPLPISRGQIISYDYLAVTDLATTNLVRGQFVQVPMGSRLLWGLVLSIGDRTEIAHTRLKYIAQIADLPPLTEANIQFLEQVTFWTLAPFGSVLRMMQSVPSAFDPPPTQQVLHLPPESGATKSVDTSRLSPVRQKIHNFLQTAPPLPAGVLARETGTSTATLRAMLDAGQLISWQQPKPEELPKELAKMQTSNTPKLQLNTAQAAIAGGMASALDGFHAHLLDGVTGSGKTEVYFQAVQQVLAAGKQVLILLPEIALTKNFQDRFETWFGMRPLVWHSGVPAAQKRAIWRATLAGKPLVLVGARSALFLPFANLGLIIVDEEHDGGFKQEDQVIYQARDMAVLRAKILAIPIILSSATPSLESWVNMQQGRYTHWQLTARFGDAKLPELCMIDLRKDPPERGKWLSPPLVLALEETLAAGEQSLLYLNRRGYAPMAVCGACGDRRLCHQCDSLLVTHKLVGRQICHHCGIAQPLSPDCSACGERDTMQLVGPGVERLAEEVLIRFPDARFTIFSSDALKGKEAIDEMLRSITDGEVDIIIGTQMAAKGHHFPNLTLVGVVDGDLGLHGGDLRAAERTFQMLTQVAGRAGRGARAGRGLIQTSDPAHPVITALQAGDRDAFLALEAEARKAAAMPPFGRLAAVILLDADLSRLEQAASALARAAPAFLDVALFGPAPAPIAQIRGRHRMRFLLSAPRHADMQKILLDWIGSAKIPAATQLQLDIDPYSFL